MLGSYDRGDSTFKNLLFFKFSYLNLVTIPMNHEYCIVYYVKHKWLKRMVHSHIELSSSYK